MYLQGLADFLKKYYEKLFTERLTIHLIFFLILSIPFLKLSKWSILIIENKYSIGVKYRTTSFQFKIFIVIFYKLLYKFIRLFLIKGGIKGYDQWRNRIS